MLSRVSGLFLAIAFLFSASFASAAAVRDHSPLHQKAAHFYDELLKHHWLNGLYVSIVPVVPPEVTLRHDVDQPGNVIHAGVWTGRYLGGVGYQYAVTKDPKVRAHAWEILRALRLLQEVTGKPGLLARGYVRGHGPVEEYEREGRDSVEWHQGQGRFADYRWYGDVSVDNFNAVLYGYAIYYDLAADAAQKAFIAHDVERLMTHLLDNGCRIIDVDGEVTRWGHVGINPDPSAEEYYKKLYAPYLNRLGGSGEFKPGLRAQLMLLPDLLIADHITGNPRYRQFYQTILDRFQNNPDRNPRVFSSDLERIARTDHSSEGQSYEALYNLIRYEKDPERVRRYQQWLLELWEVNWEEGNSLFAYMTAALYPKPIAISKPGTRVQRGVLMPHEKEGLQFAFQTLRDYPIDRVFRPVMNSMRPGVSLNPNGIREKLSTRPIPVAERPLDNEYLWKGNPYALDGWLKPIVLGWAVAADDPLVQWFHDSAGRLYWTRNGGKSWENVTVNLMAGAVQNFVVSGHRTFVGWAQTTQGTYVTRDGGLSWRPQPAEQKVEFPTRHFSQWISGPRGTQFRINETQQLLISDDQGKTSQLSMNGWRIPKAQSVFIVENEVIASGPGGTYKSPDGRNWTELKLWREERTGSVDFLHAYWMGRYYGFISNKD